MEKVYIIMPVYNRINVTSKFIDCLKKQSYQNFHLILIDDGSTDGTAEMVSKEIPSATILKGKGDWWWAGSLQQGYLWLNNIKANKEDMILLINDDTEFEVDFLKKGIEFIKNNSKSILCAQCFDKHTNELIDSGVFVDWSKYTFSQAKNRDEINCLSTRGLFMKYVDAKYIGDFFPKILPHYLSDYEYTIRAHSKGYKLLTIPELRLWTDNTNKQNNQGKESIVRFLRNMFSKRNTSNPYYACLFILLRCPFRYKLVNIIRIILNFVKKFAKVVLNI